MDTDYYCPNPLCHSKVEIKVIQVGLYPPEYISTASCFACGWVGDAQDAMTEAEKWFVYGAALGVENTDNEEG